MPVLHLLQVWYCCHATLGQKETFPLLLSRPEEVLLCHCYAPIYSNSLKNSLVGIWDVHQPKGTSGLCPE